jgi:hypothetical protein
MDRACLGLLGFLLLLLLLALDALLPSLMLEASSHRSKLAVLRLWLWLWPGVDSRALRALLLGLLLLLNPSLQVLAAELL